MNIIDINKLENVVHKQGFILAACPACLEEGADSKKCHLSVLDDGRFNCIKYSNDISHNKRILELAGTETDISNISSNNIIKQPKIKLMEETWNPEILSKLIKDHSYWEKRGVPANIIEKYQGGIAISGKMKSRYVFPIFRENESIHGFSGRYIFDNPNIMRWKHLGMKSRWIFPRLAEPNIINKSEVILVEGIGCVLGLDCVGINNVISLFGVNISSATISYLIQLNPKKIIIATNNEESCIGNKAAEKIKNILSKFFDEDKILIHLPYKKDFLEMLEKDRAEWYNKI